MPWVIRSIRPRAAGLVVAVALFAAIVPLRLAAQRAAPSRPASSHLRSAVVRHREVDDVATDGTRIYVSVREAESETERQERCGPRRAVRVATLPLGPRSVWADVVPSNVCDAHRSVFELAHVDDSVVVVECTVLPTRRGTPRTASECRLTWGDRARPDASVTFEADDRPANVAWAAATTARGYLLVIAALGPDEIRPTAWLVEPGGAPRRIELPRIHGRFYDVRVARTGEARFALDVTLMAPMRTLRAVVDPAQPVVASFVDVPVATGTSSRVPFGIMQTCGERCASSLARPDGSELWLCGFDNPNECSVDDFMEVGDELVAMVDEWLDDDRVRTFARRVDLNRYAFVGDVPISTPGARGANAHIDRAGDRYVVAWDELDARGVRTAYAREIERP